MEITWLGDTCVRFKGREGVVVADAYRSVAGPTGRGLTADICTYSHADGASVATRDDRLAPGALSTTVLGVIRPTSLESAFTIDAPGEFEVHEVLVTGRTHLPRRRQGSGARAQYLIRVRAGRPPGDPPG